jgi:hypothetical protein
MNAAHVNGRVGMRRNLVLLMLACIGTFFGVIFYFRTGAVPDAIVDSQENAMAPPQPAVAPQTNVQSMPRSAQGSKMRLPVAAPEPMQSAPLEAQAPPAAFQSGEQPADSPGGGDADARAAAIRQLDFGAPESFMILEQVVRGDAVARNRLLAVNSLRLMVLRGQNRERVTAVLRAAIADSDSNVAASARDAYEEIAQ